MCSSIIVYGILIMIVATTAKGLIDYKAHLDRNNQVSCYRAVIPGVTVIMPK